MHPIVYRTYRSLVPKVTGSVLEVGALPSNQALLCLPQLADAERVGINLDGPFEYDGFKIIRGNSNSMEFEDGRFDLVLCNATIAHDPFFWKTVDEIKRVTKPGGAIVIGSPGFATTIIDRVQAKLSRPFLLNNPYLTALLTATITYKIEEAPGDYYRFSVQAFREVIMGGLEEVEIRSVMQPPRLIGLGRKPSSRVTRQVLD